MRKYCSDCNNWYGFTAKNPHGGCTHVITTNPSHPVRPQEVYLNYAKANKDGKCKHYVDKQEGLGIAAMAGKRSAQGLGVMGEKPGIKFADVATAYSPTAEDTEDDNEEVDEA